MEKHAIFLMNQVVKSMIRKLLCPKIKATRRANYKIAINFTEFRLIHGLDSTNFGPRCKQASGRACLLGWRVFAVDGRWKRLALGDWVGLAPSLWVTFPPFSVSEGPVWALLQRDVRMQERGLV